MWQEPTDNFERVLDSIICYVLRVGVLEGTRVVFQYVERFISSDGH